MAAKAPAVALSMAVVVGERRIRVSEMTPVRRILAVISSGTILCLKNCWYTMVHVLPRGSASMKMGRDVFRASSL